MQQIVNKLHSTVGPVSLLVYIIGQLHCGCTSAYCIILYLRVTIYLQVHFSAIRFKAHFSNTDLYAETVKG